MKRTVFSLLAVGFLILAVGCANEQGRHPLFGCLGNHCDKARAENDEGAEYPGQGGQQAAAGQATGAVAYPYYTTRGPRDFLAKNPPSIGP